MPARAAGAILYRTMHTQRQRHLRLMLFLGVGLGMTALALAGYSFGFLNDLERQSIDARFSIRGTVEPPPELVTVRIDDVTLDELRQRWPFPRSLHGKVIDRLAADGAKLIAYDVQFTEPTEPEEDNALIEAVARAGNVVLVTTEVEAGGRTNIFGGDDVLREIGARPASALFGVDKGGVIRRVPYSVNELETLAVVAAEAATGRRIDPGDFEQGGAWIDYAGPPETIPWFSFSRVLRGKVPKGTFRGKIVVIGPSAPSLQDVHSTPTGELMPGAEVQANAIATALRGLPLRSAPAAVNVALIVLLGLLAPALGLWGHPLISVGGALAAGGAFAVSAQLSFDHDRILSLVYPLMALALSTVGSLGVHYVVVAFERERVRDVFSRFVPEQVVDEVLARTDADLRLGGVRLEATVMFSDLRGFTSAAENLPAERVIDVLNYYLGEMSDAILGHGGTLVSYMGDGIMAVFGAPIEQPDHADRALAAAREMLLERLPRVNEWIRGEGLGESFKMGIGLNTGPLMSGNVGHARRLEYTAVGDTTNTASRIEGMTKGTPYSLFVADSTRALLPEETAALLVYVDEVDVRGRQAKLKLWALAAERPAEEGAHPRT